MQQSWSVLLPFRRMVYQTDLTSERISQNLAENVITGFVLYSRKPYYGGYTENTLSVRKTSSNFKRQSLAPTIEGTLVADQGKIRVTLDLRPHPVWWVALCLFGFPFLMFFGAAIPAFFKTGDIALLFNGIIPAIFFYGIFRVIFQAQSSADLRFWERTLQLQELSN